MVLSARVPRPVSAALVAVLALLVTLCAGGGGADAAMLLLGHDARMDCGADGGAADRHDCRATTSEMLLLTQPAFAVDVAAPDADGASAAGAPVAIAPVRAPAPRVPRAPPLP